LFGGQQAPAEVPYGLHRSEYRERFEGAFMSRIRVLAVVLALGSIILGPIPAQAGSVWDPDDAAHRLDIRWVGVYQQVDGLMRVTISFHGRTRTRWFEDRSNPTLTVALAYAKAEYAQAWEVTFFRNAHHRLVALLCELASSCVSQARVHRLDRDTIRVRLDPFYSPFTGSYFRAWSQRPGGRLIDRTRWGIVT
jgi:hypothetical protein